MAEGTTVRRTTVHDRATAAPTFEGGASRSTGLRTARHQQRRAQQPAFGATVARVRVDVIVTDEQGRFVDDLDADDFVLFEDGAVQDILSVQLVDLAAGRIVERSAEAGRSPAVATPSRTATASDPPTERVGATAAPDANAVAAPFAAADVADLSAIVYVIDTWTLAEDPKARARLRRAWLEHVESIEAESVPRAVYHIDHLQRLRELTALTRDRATLLDALEALADEPAFRLRSLPRSFATTFRGDAAFQRYASDLDSLELIERLCDALGVLYGRKGLIWVSAGHFLTWRPFVPNLEALERMERLHRTANSANVSVYTIDPRRWIDLPDNFYKSAFDITQRSALGESGTVAGRLFAADVREFDSDSQRDMLVRTSRATGGLSFLSWSEQDRVLEAIERDISRYYLITYAPPPPDGDGRYHDIHLEVRRPDLEVRYRRGYVDYSDDEQRMRRFEAALTLPGATAGFPLRVAPWGPFERDGVLLAVFELSGRLEGLVADSGLGDDEPVFEIRGVAVPAEGGQAVRTQRAVRFGEVDFRRDGEAGGPWFVISHPWPLGALEYDVRLVVRHVATGAIGAARLQLTADAKR